MAAFGKDDQSSMNSSLETSQNKAQKLVKAMETLWTFAKSGSSNHVSLSGDYQGMLNMSF
jgi:hypothetical protein